MSYPLEGWPLTQPVSKLLLHHGSMLPRKCTTPCRTRVWSIVFWLAKSWLSRVPFNDGHLSRLDMLLGLENRFYFKAAKKSDRVKSAQVKKLEKQALVDELNITP